MPFKRPKHTPYVNVYDGKDSDDNDGSMEDAVRLVQTPTKLRRMKRNRKQVVSQTISEHINKIAQKRAKARSRQIDVQLLQDQESRKKEVHFLLVGGIDSGKSTLVKQFRIHFGDGYPEATRHAFINDALENLSDGIHLVLDHMQQWGIWFFDPYVEDIANEFRYDCPRFRRGRHRHYFLRTPDLSLYDRHFKNIVVQPEFQECLDKKDQFNPPLLYAEIYFIKHIDRVIQSDYIPTLQDILAIRKPTEAVKENRFVIEGTIFRMIDLAGQRCHRQKWIHLFEGVNVVLFLTSLAGFVELVDANKPTTVMQESMALFYDLIGNKYLWKKDFVLFLTKVDLFKEKLATTELRSVFEDFSGDQTDIEWCADFIANKFLTLRPQSYPKNKRIYSHIICCLDIDQMKRTLRDVVQKITEAHIKKSLLF